MQSPVTLGAMLMFAATLLQFPGRARSATPVRTREREDALDFEQFLEDSPTLHSSLTSDISALFFS